MRLYGSLSELSSLVIRLASGKTVTIIASDQPTAPGSNINITIPDVGDAGDTLVVADAQQTLLQKTLTSPTISGGSASGQTITTAAINSTTKLVIPSKNNTEMPTAHSTEGGLIWNSQDDVLTVGEGGGAGYKVMVDTGSSQSISSKTLNSSTFSGGTIVNIVRLHLGNLTTGVGNGHVLILDANGDVDSEATLSKARGGTGADLTNITFPGPADTGTIVLDTKAQTLSNKTIGTVIADSGTLTVSGTGALRLPLGTEANRPAGTAATLKGMIRYNDEADAFEGYNELSGWSSLGGGGTTDRVTQASHGFVVGDVLYLNGSTYTKAIATAANTAEVAGVVSRVIDSSTFELTLSGEISGLLAANFTEAELPATGEALFLSTTAGKMTVTEPSTVGHISIPVGIASGSGSMYVGIKRGVVVGAANARTTIAVANNSATNVVSVTNYNSLKLEGELNVTRSSGGNQRAYYTVEAAKNGAGTWQVSASYTGDDVLYTTLPSWDVASNNLQVTMPLVTNFSSASLTYSLNAPAVGASLPLSIDSSSLNIVADAPLSYRNRIINGDMRIDQRRGGTKITTSDFGMDRFAINQTVPGKLGLQQVADGPAGFSYCAAITVEASYSVGASDFYSLVQAVEGFNMADFAWGTADAKAVTLSFWTKASTTGTYGGTVFNESGTRRTYAFTYTINSANTWEQKTITIPGCTDGTWNTTNGAGLYLIFNLGAGSSTQTTAGSWNAGAFRGPSGTVQLVGLANGQSLRVTGVQLEVGSKASAFERRPYQQELALCQRYYEKSYPIDIVPGTNTSTGVSSAMTVVRSDGTFVVQAPLKVTKRASVTTVAYLPSGTINQVNARVNEAAFAAITASSAAEGGMSYASVFGGSSANTRFYAEFQWTASAEL